MINNKLNNQENNKIQLTDICSNFATVLYRTQNLQVAANYIHLISDQPNKLIQKSKQHLNIIHWLQNIGDEKCSQLFCLSRPAFVEMILGYSLKSQNEERYIKKDTIRQSTVTSKQRRQKINQYYSLIKIAWLSTPLIIVQKDLGLDMLKLFMGENYFGSSECNCQINFDVKRRCICLEQVENGFECLYFMAKQIKKNILYHYNNAHFTYKIKDLKKIQSFAKNQLKYQNNDLSKIFQMSLLTLAKNKGIDCLRLKGVKIQSNYYQYQQKLSIKLLEQLEKEQNQKRDKNKSKKKKNNKLKNQQKSQKQNTLNLSNHKEQTQKINNLQEQIGQESISNQSQLERKKESSISQSKNMNLVELKQQIFSKTQYIRQNQEQEGCIQNLRQQGRNKCDNVEQESINQICLVFDSSKIQTNSNTPSNSFSENISLSSEKEQYLNGEQYEIEMNIEAQGQKITQYIISGIIKQKISQINKQIGQKYSLKIIVLQQITKSINNYYPYLLMNLFGSTINGLALPNSDLDILINNIHYYLYQEPDLLKNIAKIISREYWVTNYQILSTAKVPVIKLEIDLTFFMSQQLLNIYQSTNKNTILKVDMTLNTSGTNNSGLLSSQFMQYILSYGPNLKEAILTFKIILQKYNLHQNYKGGINSYTLFLMAISYIQQYKINIYEKNSTNIFLNMLKFYSQEFNYQKYVIRYIKDSSCFLTFEQYNSIVESQALQKSGLLKIIDPINNKLIKASYNQLNEIISLFRELNTTVDNLRKKTLQVIELLILQKNRVENSIILKIGLQAVKKSEESLRFSNILF